MCRLPGTACRAGPRRTRALAFRCVWHPVGDLPARVYWRRRLVVLVVLIGVVGGGGWLGWWLVTGRDGTGPDTGTTAARAQVRPRFELT